MDAIFKLILTISLYASVVGIIILLVKMILRNKINPKWHYIIWIVLILKLFIPFGPKSPVSLFNTVQQIPQQTNFNQMYLEHQQSIAPIEEEKTKIINTTAIQDSSLYLAAKAETAAPYIWFTGAVLMLGWLIYTNYTLQRKMKKFPDLAPESINQIFVECKEKMKVKKDIDIVIQNVISTPALFGIFKPRILISPNILKLSKKEVSYVLLHELAHYKRKDLIVNYLLLLLQLVHWFNPVIWYCFKRIRHDMELATDEKVLTLLESGERKEYGNALLSILASFNISKLAPRLVGMVDDKKNIEKRIKVIKMMDFFKSRQKTILIIGVICVVMLSGILLTGAIAKSEPNMEHAINTLQPMVTANIQSNIPTQSPIDEAIGVTIKSQTKNYANGEFSTEAHILLDTEEKDGVTKAYVVAGFATFQFENGMFVNVCNVVSFFSAVITFSKNENGEYSLVDYKMPNTTGGSIKLDDLNKKWSGDLNRYIADLTKQQEAQANQYLQSIGRTAKVVSSEGVAMEEFERIQEKSEALYNLCNMFFIDGDTVRDKYPRWIGSKEFIESGIRYTYETSKSKTTDGYDLVTFKKIKEDGTIANEYQYKMVGDEPQLVK